MMGDEKPKITVQEVRDLIEAGRAAEREELRTKVEALPPENVYSHRGAVVLRADVLDLFDGISGDG
jgi:hypothetical protein